MARSTSILSLLLHISTVLATTEKSKPIQITRDVAIIGGGASGAYAAVRLREDLNKSIIVIEPRPNLGGHTSTYHIPGTNATVDYGVQSYLPYGPASSFFARFNIPTERFTPERLTPLNVDVETGKLLSDYRAPSANATNEAFSRWLAITLKYRDYLEPGYWNFPLPQDIPDDFLLPFGQFAKRERIEDALPRIVAISGVGTGGLRDTLTLTVLQAFGASLTEGGFSTLDSESPKRAFPSLQNLLLTRNERERILLTPDPTRRFPPKHTHPPHRLQQRPAIHARPRPPRA
jgi:hypothetical protein